jgi:hypothetical protein
VLVDLEPFDGFRLGHLLNVLGQVADGARPFARGSSSAVTNSAATRRGLGSVIS